MLLYYSEVIFMCKEKTCCITGHRPTSLPWKYSESSWKCIFLKLRLFFKITKAIKNGYTNYIVGMAQGVDTYAAEMLIGLKRINKAIKIEAAIPCETQDKFWLYYSRVRYNKILSKCDRQTVISKEYTHNCMQERNRYMVDKSSKIIAVWNGKPSGTGRTINYAYEKGLKIEIIKI